MAADSRTRSSERWFGRSGEGWLADRSRRTDRRVLAGSWPTVHRFPNRTCYVTAPRASRVGRLAPVRGSPRAERSRPLKSSAAWIVVAALVLLGSSSTPASANPSAVGDTFHVARNAPATRLDVLANDPVGTPGSRLSILAVTQP